MTTKIPAELSSTPGITDSSDATAITIDSSERVGIGTTSPTSKLTVSGSDGGKGIELQVSTGSVQYLMAYDRSASDYIDMQIDAENLRFGTNTGAERMRIDSSGKVGIGTTAPLAPLHVVTSSSETDLIVQSNTGGTGSAQGGRLILQLGAQTSTGSGAADTQAGDTLGKIRFDGQGTDYSYQGGEVSVIVQTGDGTATRNEQGTRMSFFTMNVGVGYAVERFRIAQNGDLSATDTTIGSLSDERIKKNITDFTGGLDLIKSLQPRTFEFKDTSGKRKSGTRRGFVAQEVLEIDDYWIYEQEANDKNDVEYEYTKDTEKVYVSKLNDKDAMYVSAIQELQDIIEDLKSRIETLEG